MGKKIPYTPIENEMWADIIGYEGKYKISNLGRVMSIHKLTEPTIIRPTVRYKNDYLHIILKTKDGRNTRGKRFRIHRLVGAAFIPNPNNYPQINHKDAVKTNNRADNLEWCTNTQNYIHAVKMGLNKPPNQKQFKLRLQAPTPSGEHNSESKPFYKYDMDLNLIEEIIGIRAYSRKIGVPRFDGKYLDRPNRSHKGFRYFRTKVHLDPVFISKYKDYKWKSKKYSPCK